MATGFDNSIITQIQQATDIVDVVSEHLNLVKKGKEYVGLCPFHQDHKPSMYVNPVKQIFKCFACGAGGDVFKFIQLRENLTFPDAIERLAERAGIKIEPVKRKVSGSTNAAAGATADPKYLVKLNNWVLEQFRNNFNDEQLGSSARKYVSDRGISDESVKTWNIGFAADSWDSLLNASVAKKIPASLMTAGGFAVPRDTGGNYDKFRNRLMFPISDPTGRVIGFGGRTLGDDPAKYMNSPATPLFDKSKCLYGLDKARHSIVSGNSAVIVEGYTDVIMCHQFGCTNVVATLGTSLTAEHARMLRRYAKRIVLVFDSDIAGIEAANRAIEVCIGQGVDIRIAFVQEGKDPCEFLLAKGTDAFNRILENAIDVMEFKWQRLQDGLAGSDNIADKKEAIEEYFRVVAAAMNSQAIDPISKSLMKTKLQQITGLSADEVQRQLKKLMARGQSYAVRDQKVVSQAAGEDLMLRAQREILEVLLNESSLCEKVAAHIGPDEFGDDELREIALAVFDAAASGQKTDIVDILQRIESVQAGRQAVTLAENGENKAHYEERLTDALKIIDKYKEEQEKDLLAKQIKCGQDQSLIKLTDMLKKSNKRNPGMTLTGR